MLFRKKKLNNVLNVDSDKHLLFNPFTLKTVKMELTTIADLHEVMKNVSPAILKTRRPLPGSGSKKVQQSWVCQSYKLVRLD